MPTQMVPALQYIEVDLGTRALREPFQGKVIYYLNNVTAEIIHAPLQNGSYMQHVPWACIACDSCHSRTPLDITREIQDATKGCHTGK